MSGPGIVEISGLEVRFGVRQAVAELSLSVPEGSLFGLLGPNGAGKTTTLSCVAGLRRPDAGEVRVDGRLVHTGKGWVDPETAARVGLAPQALALYPELTVGQNLAFFGGLYGLSGAALAERIDEALTLSQLGPRRADRVGTLSGGMQRRLNLAAALLHRPKVLICDEPTTGVDPQSRHHLFETIRALNREGLTVIYTTHYMEEVQALCDRVAIMDAGRVVASDTLSALLAPHHQGGPQGRRLEAPRHDFKVALNAPVEVERLTQVLEAAGLPVAEVHARLHTLEDLFLELTGHGLRDDE